MLNASATFVTHPGFSLSNCIVEWISGPNVIFITRFATIDRWTQVHLEADNSAREEEDNGTDEIKAFMMRRLS